MSYYSFFEKFSQSNKLNKKTKERQIVCIKHSIYVVEASKKNLLSPARSR